MTRYTDYRSAATMPQENPPQVVENLCLHLKARLEEFHCVKVAECNLSQGFLAVRFQGFAPESLASTLESKSGIFVDVAETIVFHLQNRHSFEDLDYVWGQLFHILL